MANPNWKKGMPSANPKGAPEKQDSLSYLMRTILHAKDGEDKKTKAIRFVESVIKAGTEGNDTCRKLIMQYHDGMPQQKVDVTSQGEQVGVMVYMPKKD